jgi:hypothetical protein
MCGQKQRYPSAEVARGIGLYEQESRGGELWMYACQVCRGWHLTRSPQKDPAMKVSYYLGAEK